ncbi:MAG: alpha/beta fold hydrolase [Solirubrobacteraceae bacterium]|jgi:acetyl esterase/lipase
MAADWSADRLGPADGPVLAVFIHGGFWRARFDAGAIAELATECGRDGYWTWNVEYPRVGMAGGGWPGTALAVRDAVRAAILAAGGRPVALVGHSAGGHLALWAAGECPVAEVVSLAGVCDLQAAVAARLGAGAVLDFLGADPGADPGADRAADVFAAASPIARLPLGVPALLIHGDADHNVPIEQSRSYAAAAAAAGDRCRLLELPGADHFELVDPRGRAWPVIADTLATLAGG